ncbi:MAG: hypothetical protein M0Z52_09025 [Actinomycetota bacterium]|nr:hypothetical protein [Actinomycetota bacterium]
MKGKLGRFFAAGALCVFAVLFFGGCGGGGSSSPSGSSGAPVSGFVADGAVANATVTAYTDSGLTNQIGSGSSDSTGKFSFSLTVTPVPSPFYLKSTGGIDLSTGLPAPTMVFAGITNGAGINITPLTDTVYQLSLSVGLANAITSVEGQLGVTNADIYSGISNSATAAAVNKVADSGSMAATLPDGAYYMTLIHAGSNEIQNPKHTFGSIADILTNSTEALNITVSSGAVSGTMSDASNGTCTVSGRVSGDAVVLQTAPCSITGKTMSAGGTIGRLGGITGTFLVNAPGSGHPLRAGVFAASAIPQNVNASTFANAVGASYTGPFNFLARGLFGAGHNLIWGQEPQQPIPSTMGGTFTPSNISVAMDNGSGINPTTDTLASASGFGSMVSSKGLPTALAVMQYTDISGENIFIVQAAGSRGGIWVTANPANSNEADGIGDLSVTKPGSVDSLSDSSYNIYVASVDPGELGQSRSSVLGGMPVSPGTADFSVCSGNTGLCTSLSGFGVGNSPELGVFAGDVLGMKKDDDDVWDGAEQDGSNEHIRLVHFFGSGAFSGGEEQPVNVPMMNGGGSGIGNFPSAFVGMAVPTSGSAPSFSGTLSFLARNLYTTDGNYNFNWGSITISGTSGSITYAGSDGGSGTASLSVLNTNGVYHLSFPSSGGGYIDVFWPVGGRKAIYFSSDSNGSINEIGEAYMTQ